jgi:mannobiose 2-epimerase
MEGFLVYYNLTRDRKALKRITELMFILSLSFIDPAVGVWKDRFKADWTVLRGALYDTVSFGHILEVIWLLIEACQLTGMPYRSFIVFFESMFAYTLRYGFDLDEGGFYYRGRFHAKANKREKIWWVQAEGLVSALRMYLLTKHAIYLDCFIKTLAWIKRYQVDWENLEWHEMVLEDGKASGSKANEWKSPYHNGRAILECLRLLSNSYHEQEEDDT